MRLFLGSFLTMAFCGFAAHKTFATPIEFPDLLNAPASFLIDYQYVQAVFVDFRENNIDLTIDTENKRLLVNASIEFYQPETGFPVIDLMWPVSTLEVDGRAYDADDLEEISTPDGVTTVNVIKKILRPGKHTLQMTYEITEAGAKFPRSSFSLQFDHSNVWFLTNMADIERTSGKLSNQGRGALEQWFPANLIYDHFRLNIKINNLPTGHHVIANGVVGETTNSSNTVAYPNFFASNSFFLHIFSDSEKICSEDFTVQNGNERTPIKIYSQNCSVIADAQNRTIKAFLEYVNTYGAFPYDALVIYLSDSEWSIEYSGAIRTNLESIEHEIFHQWFGRGAMPADGNAMWIDEALARWNDREKPIGKTAELCKLEAYQLVGFSPYLRFTPKGSYSKGADFFAAVARVLSDAKYPGGLDALLANFYKSFKRRAYTHAQFEGFVTLNTSDYADLKPYFDRMIRNETQMCE